MSLNWDTSEMRSSESLRELADVPWGILQMRGPQEESALERALRRAPIHWKFSDDAGKESA
jgi:hypothetical protein